MLKQEDVDKISESLKSCEDSEFVIPSLVIIGMIAFHCAILSECQNTN